MMIDDQPKKPVADIKPAAPKLGDFSGLSSILDSI